MVIFAEVFCILITRALMSLRATFKVYMTPYWNMKKRKLNTTSQNRPANVWICACSSFHQISQLIFPSSPIPPLRTSQLDHSPKSSTALQAIQIERKWNALCYLHCLFYVTKCWIKYLIIESGIIL